MFVLPSLGSIVGFTLLFVVVSRVAAWFATSSPRLSYFELQMALAYYLTIFQGFGFSTSLGITRDRLLGILLGLLATAIMFDGVEARRIRSLAGGVESTLASNFVHCRSSRFSLPV